MDPHTTIIPVAGGKGGVGKTFITASLAIALARRGHSTIVVDLDFGNSNLYSLLGMENRYPGIAEFLLGPPGRPLQELAVPTGIPNLRFIAGDGWTPFTANITHAQKQTLLRELSKIDTEYLLLDLGAGSSYNTLDLFHIRNRGILVTKPEQPAILSMLVFMKNLVLRAIDQKLRKDPSLVDLLNELRHQPVSGPPWSVRSYRDRVAAKNPQAGAEIDRLCSQIRPRAIYNMADSAEDAQFFRRVDATLEDVLSIKCDHIGFVPSDSSVTQSLKRGGAPAANLAAHTREAIDRIASRIEHYWRHSIEGSADLLEEYVVRQIAHHRDQAD